MFHYTHAIDWAMYAYKSFPKVQGQIKSQTPSSPISNLPTKSIVYDLKFAHVQDYPRPVHEQIS